MFQLYIYVCCVFVFCELVNYEVVGFDVGSCFDVLLSCPTSDLVMALGRGEIILLGQTSGVGLETMWE